MAKFLYPPGPQPDRIIYQGNADLVLENQLLAYAAGGIFVVEKSTKKLLVIEHPVTFVPWERIREVRIDRHRAILAALFGLALVVGAVGGAAAVILFGVAERLLEMIWIIIIGLGTGATLLFGLRRIRIHVEDGGRSYAFTSKAMQKGIKDVVQDLLRHCVGRGIPLRSNLLEEGERPRPADPEGGRPRTDEDAGIRPPDEGERRRVDD